MNDSALDKEQVDYTHLPQKKDSRKMKIDLPSPIIFTIHQLLFHLSETVHHAMQKNLQELIREDIN